LSDFILLSCDVANMAAYYDTCIYQRAKRKIMAKQSAPAKPADTRIEGAINDVAIKGMIPAVETIQAFAREIAQMSGQALARTNWHIEKLRKAQSTEEAAAIQADFFKESMEHAVQHTREHAVQHTRKYFEMLATFPHEPMQPVNMAVEAAEAARHATAAKVGRHSQVAHKA
jgi:hypothetical protein